MRILREAGRAGPGAGITKSEIDHESIRTVKRRVHRLVTVSKLFLT
jgi:hypothetical protein